MTRAPKTHSLLSGRGASAITGTIYDAPVMAAATRPPKDRWGCGAYVFAAVKQALTAAPVEFTIIADGKEIRVRAVSVMLANMGELFAQFIPFGLPLAPRPRSEERRVGTESADSGGAQTRAREDERRTE